MSGMHLLYGIPAVTIVKRLCMVGVTYLEFYQDTCCFTIAKSELLQWVGVIITEFLLAVCQTFNYKLWEALCCHTDWCEVIVPINQSISFN